MAIISYQIPAFTGKCLIKKKKKSDSYTIENIENSHKHGPISGYVWKIYTNWQRSGMKPSTYHDTVKSTSDTVERNPHASVRLLSRALKISQFTVWRNLRFTQKKKTYHLQVLHPLEMEIMQPVWQCVLIFWRMNVVNLVDHILCTDQASFT